MLFISIATSDNRGNMANQGFVFGTHQFLHPSVNGPISRLHDPKRQIKGAPPPTYLDGLARESTDKSVAAAALHKGEFCGHGEPTMTIFDVVIDGDGDLEVDAIIDDACDENGANPLIVAARRQGQSDWHVLFERAWDERSMMLTDVRSRKLTSEEVEELGGEPLHGKVAIGFEYPCDAQSRDDVTWLTIDVLEDGKRKPTCIVDAEMA